MEAFSGTCGGTLTSLGCQNSTTGSAAEVLTVSGLSSGTTYFVRVFSNANGSGQGTFTVCVTTPYDPCASITNITSCGSSVTVNIPAGTGAYASSSCGYTTSGIEKIFTFTPSYSGAYSILNVSSYTYIDYQYKAASGGCSNANWNCIDDISASNTTSPTFNLTAGTQYYILLDPESIVAGTVEFKIVCPPTCIPPSGLTTGTVYTNSTSIRWIPPSSGNVPASYDLYYSTSSTAPNGSTIPTIAAITDTFQYVNGLAANTTYYVWVRSFCGGTDYSTWVALPSFTTAVYLMWKEFR
ncbi:MAG: fibronectin type III domain-containing protein [Chitinophagales bacterium]